MMQFKIVGTILAGILIKISESVDYKMNCSKCSVAKYLMPVLVEMQEIVSLPIK